MMEREGRRRREETLLSRARALRREQTLFEAELWQQLRAKRFGAFKFRRQQPIGPYIVDFVCFHAHLVVELDGSQHLQNQAYDSHRDEWLKSEGFRVLRVWNNDWISMRESVLEKIWQILHDVSHPLPNPSPIKGEGLIKPQDDTPPFSLTEGEGFTRSEDDVPPLSPRGRGVGGEGLFDNSLNSIKNMMNQRLME